MLTNTLSNSIMNKKAIILALALPVCAGVFAQGLHKEITVEQQIVPKKRDASRITVLPTVTLPPIQPVRLTFSDRVVTSRPASTITTLEPVAFGDKLYTSPYRGYVALGVFPLFNADLSAGYRLMDTDKTRLSLWGQYNGDVYRENIKAASGDTKLYWRDHTAAIGADLHQAVGSTSFLDAELNYTYGYHNMPAGLSTYSESTNKVNAGITFNSNAEGLMYAAGLNYQHFGFGDPSLPSSYQNTQDTHFYLPVKQNLIGGRLSALLPTGESSHIGIDGDARILMTSEHNIPLYPYIDEYGYAESRTTGLISVTPHYLYSTPTVTARLGAKVDFTLKDGKVLHISPDVTLAWTPSQVIGLELRAHGGSTLNSLAELYDVTPYINGSFFYSQSHIPYAFDGRVTLGPFLGASLEFFGGYAKADKWLMPVGADLNVGGQVFDPVDLSGWHLGAAIGYSYRKTATVRLSYETAPNDYDNAYYEWRDRAKHVVNADLSLRPLKPLLVTLNWEFRAGRRTYDFSYLNYDETGSPDLNLYNLDARSLKAVSTVNIGVGYEYSDRLTVFARGENLLNRHYIHLGDRRSQGITALVGAALKF